MMENGSRPSTPILFKHICKAFLTILDSRPVFTYLKSRGFYAGVQVDGTVVIERTDENERFYGQKIGVADILAGKARHPPYEIKMLMETVKAAEGRNDFDRGIMAELADQPAPGDVNIESPTTNYGPIFGIPEPDDPDPFGVLALEREGLEIREAGSKSRPASTQFEYNPSPTSPIYNKFHRRSMDTLGSRSNRESYMSNISSRARTSIDRATQTTEMGTQTDDFTPSTSPSRSNEHKRILEEDEHQVREPEEIDYTKIDLGEFAHLNHSQEFDGTTVNDSPREHEDEHHINGTDGADDSYISGDEDDEEPVVFEAASAQATVFMPQAVKARGGLVDIPKRPAPPPLPPRNMARTSRVLMVDQASGQSPIRSPTQDGFEDVDLHGVDSQRKSIESHKSVVTEDAEKADEEPMKKSLEELVELELKQSNLETISPAVEEPLPSFEVVDAEVTRHSEELDEKDDFHSMPATPVEHHIEVK
jgi:hypothetical protein